MAEYIWGGGWCWDDQGVMVGDSRAAVQMDWFSSPEHWCYSLAGSTPAAGGMRCSNSSAAKPPGLTWVGILLVPLTEQQSRGELVSQPQWGLTYPKSPGEASGLFVSYNATFSHCAPHFRRAPCLCSAGDIPASDTASPAGFKGPAGNGIAANTISLASLSEPMEQDKRDSSPSSCLSRGVGRASLSVLMSHNYFLTAKTNGRNGESDTKSKVSQVIDSCHLPSPQPRLARETQW